MFDQLRADGLIPLQESSARIVEDKRLLPGEKLEDARKRVAKALAAVETDPDYWEAKFIQALRYAIPGGRIMSNAGAGATKTAVSLINCTVSAEIEDSMRGIMEAATNAAVTLKYGCGIGYNFSNLRPRGAYVSGAGAYTNGPLPFMDIFDATCKTVSSAGGRRGAQMGVLDSFHPDIEAFISAKADGKRLQGFNLSVWVSDELVQAVNEGKDYPLYFPSFPTDVHEFEPIYRYWPTEDDRFEKDEQGRVKCKVYRKVPASDLWQLIMRSTFEAAEPGVLFEGQINRMNPLWFAEWIRATNPCGEQPLPPDGACLLGSVNLPLFVKDPFTDYASLDWGKLTEVVGVFARMLDNVVEINGLPLEGQRREIFRKRRHGMGFLGLGSALMMLGLRYGSAEAVEFTERVSKEIAVENWRQALILSKEKGPAPVMLEDFELTPRHFMQCPQLARDGYSVGDTLPGRVLHARYSPYMQRIASVDPDLVEQLAELGARYSHATSIAPTGTMAAGEGNNASNGIEPTFSHYYVRNMIVPGKKTKEAIPMYSYELLAYKQLMDPQVDPINLPEAFKATADTVTPKEHVDMQAAAQKWIDSAISKTVNCPTDITFEDFQRVYLYAHQQGLKGCTTFRFNPDRNQGVLVRPEDLEATIYEFRLADGTTARFKGSDIVDYDGNQSTAANLFEALHKGNYGTF